jgi:hypothetical protein
MIRGASLAILLLASACGPASTEGVEPGIYGNVVMSGETGDLGGMELELIGSGADARVEYVYCEGWCNSVHKAPVDFTDDGFAFQYVDQYEGPGPVSERFDVKAVRLDNGLRVTVTPASNPDQAFSRTLPRIKSRFGLSVASVPPGVD